MVTICILFEKLSITTQVPKIKSLVQQYLKGLEEHIFAVWGKITVNRRSLSNKDFQIFKVFLFKVCDVVVLNIMCLH